MKFKKAEWLGYFGFCEEKIYSRWKQLPDMLPWYEPSINMLYLEACSSWVFGNNVASCIITATLLEHSLKMAFLDKENNGANRKITDKQYKKYSALGKILDNDDKTTRKILMEIIPNEENFNWWINVAKPFRNKFAHMDIRRIIENYSDEEFQGEYSIDPIVNKDPGNWGHLWHRFANNLANKMLNDTYRQLIVLFKNTEWKSDLSWWESQQRLYESFFLGEGIKRTDW